MHRLVLLFVLLAVGAPVRAQYPLSLGDPAAPVPGAGYHLVGVRDLRADTSRVGTARLAPAFSPQPVVLRGGAAPAVRRYLAGALPQTEDSRPLLIGIRELDVWETREGDFAHQTTARAHLAFFAVDADGRLAPLDTADVTTQIRGWGTMTPLLNDNLGSALLTAVRRFAARGVRDVPASAYVDADAALVPLPDPLPESEPLLEHVPRPPLVLDLAPPARPRPGAAYHLARVLDLRPDTSALGAVESVPGHGVRVVVMEGGTANAVRRYLAGMLPPTEGSRPLTIAIRSLDVWTDVAANGLAAVRLEFFVTDAAGRVASLQTHSAETYVDAPVDEPDGYADNVRRALREAVEQFLSYQDGREEPVAYEDPAVALRPIPVPVPAPSYGIISASIMLGGGAARGGLIGAGGEVGRWGLLSLMVGANAGLLQLVDVEADTIQGGYVAIAEPYGSALVRLGPTPFTVEVDLHLPLLGGVTRGGRQPNRSPGDSDHIFGARLGAHLLFHPLRSGPFLGVGVYRGAYTGSDVYRRESGVRLTFGWRAPT